jgi:hypothetical protein
MGFLDIFTKKNGQNSFDLALLPYAREFDPVRQKAKLLSIKQFEDKLVPFKIVKATNKGRWPLMEFDHFPLEQAD